MIKKKYKIFKNKYFWISISFFIWISFFDSNSLVLHYKFKKNIQNMTHNRDCLKKKVSLEGTQLKKLTTDSKYIEKLAREKFYMKKEDEDLFIVSNKTKDRTI
ncbi:septum formation initiator family protein [Blattabacterium sp. (Blaberus giganteus)]|uniref:FtsB family cell division protein n=1 Tax=Blattabacterium sp. (Blaberus giganteus) TaxID=1186051 RepID=UPI00025F6E5F|nr:septum formation initiator family protein [Blattabacterium sp. (Blaberus giganteus)]AFJ90558.1 septum formation initiator-related protein [Blattabacterium sp. (Blaberus giganteus)]